MRPVLPLLVLLAACADAPSTPPVSAAEPASPPAEASAPVADTAASAPADTSEWTARIIERPASGDGQALLAAVRTARHEGYDRLAFEFEGARPAVHVEYVDRPVRACGSGEVVPLPGDAWLEVRFSGARAHTEAGEPTVDVGRRELGLPNALELVRTCDFEGEVTWVAGVVSPEPVRVTTLDGPPRVAVDVRHR